MQKLISYLTNHSEEEVLVFDKENLFNLIDSPGFRRNLVPTLNILSIAYPVPRHEAEKRTDIIQLVSAFIVSCSGLYLTYKRSAKLPEKRLQNKSSIVFGGHISSKDFDGFPKCFDLFDPIYYGISPIFRELDEEISFSEQPKINFLGLIYDDSALVSSQHLGIVYHVILKSKNYKINEKTFLLDAAFQTNSQILLRKNEFENWTIKILESRTLGDEKIPHISYTFANNKFVNTSETLSE